MKRLVLVDLIKMRSSCHAHNNDLIRQCICIVKIAMLSHQMRVHHGFSHQAKPEFIVFGS